VQLNIRRHWPDCPAHRSSEFEDHARKVGGGRGDQARGDRIVEPRGSDEEAGRHFLPGSMGPGDEGKLGIAHHRTCIGARRGNLKPKQSDGGAT
jgi:hypothetical protein